MENQDTTPIVLIQLFFKKNNRNFLIFFISEMQMQWKLSCKKRNTGLKYREELSILNCLLEMKYLLNQQLFNTINIWEDEEFRVFGP